MAQRYRALMTHEEAAGFNSSRHATLTWVERVENMCLRSGARNVASAVITITDRPDIFARTAEVTFDSTYWTGRP